ncbi:MAG: NTP transferase domain-containing protein [Desulfobacteraceae bacterium]|nr:NTP transferase domain-containing protein [Desulfobacteraceae bacterium]MBC2758071.1 NTP transferase domain-containing protein [Desulfobacteraceae bacterium]
MNDLYESVVIIILAAGKGTRMKSDKAKVLHSLSGRPMIMHVVETAVKVTGKEIIIVIGNQAEKVKEVVSASADVKFALQKEQKGTGHAVKCALPELSQDCDNVVILSGDVPLIKSSTIRDLIKDHVNHENDVTVLGVCLENPFGYGRIVENKSGGVEKIVEETDANEFEKKINTVNSGIYCVKRDFLEISLSELKSNNKQNEIYLTDIVEVANNYHKKIGVKSCEDQAEVMGINTPQDLLNIETMQMES